MRITDYGLFRALRRWLFLRMMTSDGTVGWGEPVVGGRMRAVAGSVEELLDSYQLGESPDWYNPIWRHGDGGVAEW